MINIRQGVVGNDGAYHFMNNGLERGVVDAAKMLCLKMEKCLPGFMPQAIQGFPTLLTVIRPASGHERTFVSTFEGHADEMRPLFRQAVEVLLCSDRLSVVDEPARRSLVVSLLEPDAKAALVERIALPQERPPFTDEAFRDLIDRKLEQPHLRFADMVPELGLVPHTTEQ